MRKELTAQREEREESLRKEAEHKVNIPNLITHWTAVGQQLFQGERLALWTKIVPIRLNDLYEGMELGMCVELVEALESKSFEECKITLDNQGHSGMSFGLICAMLKEFSDKGEEFVKYVKGGN